jgi:hypothetical protein
MTLDFQDVTVCREAWDSTFIRISHYAISGGEGGTPNSPPDIEQSILTIDFRVGLRVKVCRIK